MAVIKISALIQCNKDVAQYVAVIYTAFDLLFRVSKVKLSDGPRVEVGSCPGREMRAGNVYQRASSRPVNVKHVGHRDIAHKSIKLVECPFEAINRIDGCG